MLLSNDVTGEYEWMPKLICYYKNIVHSLTQTLKPLVPIFILKMICKKKKLLLVTGMDGNFQLLTQVTVSAVPRLCPLESGKSHLQQLLVKDSYITVPA